MSRAESTPLLPSHARSGVSPERASLACAVCTLAAVMAVSAFVVADLARGAVSGGAVARAGAADGWEVFRSSLYEPGSEHREQSKESEQNDPLGPSTLTRVWLSGYPEAVCNDGSPAAFYLGAGKSSSSPSTWLIFLGEGGECWDEVTCAERWDREPSRMSSQGFGSTIAVGGLFSQDPSLTPYADAHKVKLRYCTSDAHVGDTARWGFEFRGQAVVRAMLAELSTHELGIRAGDTVVFGGGSAGGRGATLTFEYVPEMLPSGVTLEGIFDSGAWAAIEPMQPQATSFSTMDSARIAMVNLNQTARAGESCTAAYAPTGELWKCFFTGFRLPFVATGERRVLVVASLYDKMQLTWNMNQSSLPFPDTEAFVPSTPAEYEYAEEFRSRMQGSTLAPLTGAVVVAPACYEHLFYASRRKLSQRLRGANTSVSEVVQRFENGTVSPGTFYFETCEGFSCGCPTLPYDVAE
mmetsp:Transcript_4378/g.15192  ORF Transcript_4378/g.15192 Transcript_4378/m.15192 type:complete len:467 (-) Transcript_4378:87-1487(-)